MSLIKKEFLDKAIKHLEDQDLKIELEEGVDYYTKEMTCFRVVAEGTVWMYADEDAPEIHPDQVDWDDWQPEKVDSKPDMIKYYDFDDNERSIPELKAIKIQEELTIRKAIELKMPPWYIEDKYQKRLKEFE